MSRKPPRRSPRAQPSLTRPATFSRFSHRPKSDSSSLRRSPPRWHSNFRRLTGPPTPMPTFSRPHRRPFQCAGRLRPGRRSPTRRLVITGIPLWHGVADSEPRDLSDLWRNTTGHRGASTCECDGIHTCDRLAPAPQLPVVPWGRLFKHTPVSCLRNGCVRGQLHAFLSNKKIGLIDPGSKSF